MVLGFFCRILANVKTIPSEVLSKREKVPLYTVEISYCILYIQ
jgi:hypothetical protein